MKTISPVLIFMIFCIAQLPTRAQFNQIAESSKFEEPTSGYAKILQMQNGNTVYIHITAKNGIDVRIYDASHTEKVVSTLDINIDRVKLNTEMSMFPSVNKEEIEGVFEINNDIVVFIQEFDKKKSVLYRIIIDGNTAKLKEEKEIFSRQWVSYYVKKDFDSDNYAIMTSGRIYHYNTEHTEINSSDINSPETDGAHASFYYQDMIVLGKDRVCAFYLATDKTNDFKGNLYMVTLEKGSDKVSFDKLNLPNDLLYDGAIAKYDPTDKKIIFLTVAKLKAKSTDYDTYLTVIDPVSKKMERISDFGPTASLNQAYAEKYDKKKGYSGLPQDLFINADGSFSVIYEEIMVQSTSSGNYTRTDTKLGKIVINTIDKQGKLLSSYLVPKAHWIIFTELGLFYHIKQETTAQTLWRGNQYKPFKFIDGPKGRFIFFNDTERNNEVKKDKFVEVQGVTDCDAFMYQLGGSDMFPNRKYAFQDTKKNHTMAMFSVSDYDKKTNTYVTLKKESARDKTIKLVWLQPE